MIKNVQELRVFRAGPEQYVCIEIMPSLSRPNENMLLVLSLACHLLATLILGKKFNTPWMYP